MVKQEEKEEKSEDNKIQRQNCSFLFSSTVYFLFPSSCPPVVAVWLCLAFPIVSSLLD